MATSLTDDAKHQVWAEARHAETGRPWTRAEWLWTLFGLALLVTFLLFVVDGYALRGVLAAD
jgi:hypothetical protein